LIGRLGRLFLFVVTDTNDKTDDCNDERAKLEEDFPSHVHGITSLGARKANRKDLHFLGMRKPTATVMVTPTGKMPRIL